MPRGGKRQGTPGQAYGNRTDLQGSKPAALVPTGQPYGERKNLVDAQNAVPVAPAGTVVPGAAPPSPVGAAPAQGPPVDLPAFGRPSDRPGEPLTAGMPMGPGPGPEVLGAPRAGGTLAQLVESIAASAPLSPDIQALLQTVRR